MNPSMTDTLIDENEIREALKPLRPDSVAFNAGVQSRIAMAANSLKQVQRPEVADKINRQQSDWLRVAASFAPFHLLTRNVDANLAPVSFAALSFGKKLVVVVAFPFLCFLMVGLTAIGMWKIHTAQKGQAAADIDIEQARLATTAWWKRYGWIAMIVFVLTLAAPFLGWTTPLMMALVGSGFAAVSFVRTLAKENLVERSIIGGMCVSGLGLLGQLSNTFSSHTSMVLDPNLITGVLFAGAAFVMAFIQPTKWTSHTPNHGNRITMWKVMGIAASLSIMTVCTQSYWRGVRTSNIQSYVKSFDGSRLGLWEDWADAAKWLDETNVGYDKPIVREHFQQELKRNPKMRDWMFTAAVRSGLFLNEDLPADADNRKQLVRLTDSLSSANPFLNLNGEYYQIAALAADDELSLAERDTLTKRLIVTWNRLASSDHDYDRLRTALLLTELFERLDSQILLEQRTSEVHRWLVESQVTNPAVFHSGGGFYISAQAPDSNRHVTLAAVQLMEIYGMPAEIDIQQLRSYLRPNFLYDITEYDYVPKKIARDRLNRIASVRPLTVFDLMQSELPLSLAVMLVLLLIYATLSSPVRRVQSSLSI